MLIGKDIWAFALILSPENRQFEVYEDKQMKVHVLYLGVDYSCLFVHKVLGGSSGLNKFRMVPPFLYPYGTYW